MLRRSRICVGNRVPVVERRPSFDDAGGIPGVGMSRVAAIGLVESHRRTPLAGVLSRVDELRVGQEVEAAETAHGVERRPTAGHAHVATGRGQGSRARPALTAGVVEFNGSQALVTIAAADYV